MPTVVFLSLAPLCRYPNTHPNPLQNPLVYVNVCRFLGCHTPLVDFGHIKCQANDRPVALLTPQGKRAWTAGACMGYMHVTRSVATALSTPAHRFRSQVPLSITKASGHRRFCSRGRSATNARRLPRRTAASSVSGSARITPRDPGVPSIALWSIVSGSKRIPPAVGVARWGQTSV